MDYGSAPSFSTSWLAAGPLVDLLHEKGWNVLLEPGYAHLSGLDYEDAGHPTTFNGETTIEALCRA
ncbi:hypothetical protein, partial [Staphylococcus aureus]|uniref:hypothetical protein n=1 Tax=Staphylococcus aureus TaxID=1280 RepID=UPI001ED9B82E